MPPIEWDPAQSPATQLQWNVFRAENVTNCQVSSPLTLQPTTKRGSIVKFYVGKKLRISFGITFLVKLSW